MLFDPKWVDPRLKLSGLIAWLENQPADQTYNYFCEERHCLISQYLSEVGLPFGRGHYGRFADANIRIAVAQQQPWTFGAALERARAVLAAQ